MRLVCVTDNCVERSSGLWGEHGLCFWVETDGQNVLWDTGQSATVLEHNLACLGLARRPLHALGQSHAHYDHSGALLHVLEEHPKLTVYGNASLCEPRYARSGEVVRPIGLQRLGDGWRDLADLRLSDAPQEIAVGVKATGRITPRPYPQGSSPHHLVEVDGELRPDPYADDMSLVLEVPGGIVLLCGCCHAGLRNTLETVRRLFDAPLLAIIGGTHLAQAADAEIEALIGLLRREGSPRLYLNHCTGERPLYALHAAFGDCVLPCPAGTEIAFG